MTTLDILRRPSALPHVLGHLLLKPQDNVRKRGPRANPHAPLNRYEGAYDETKPFFMQRNWRA